MSTNLVRGNRLWEEFFSLWKTPSGSNLRFSNLDRMRWSDLFDHLENDFAQEADQGARPVVGADDYLLELCARAKKAKHPVTIALVTGEILHVNPRGIGVTWVSGLSGGHHEVGMVIPVHSIDWVDGRLESDRAPVAGITDVSLVEVVDDLICRKVFLTVRTRHASFRGTLVGQGVDYVDCALSAPHSGATVRRIFRDNLVMLVLGQAAWG
jgi:hypothetical protein